MCKQAAKRTCYEYSYATDPLNLFIKILYINPHNLVPCITLRLPSWITLDILHCILMKNLKFVRKLAMIKQASSLNP